LEEADENPDWASNDSTRWQGCWTSRGNKDSYAKLVDHIAGKIIKYLKQFPDRNSMMIGQHDIGGNTPNVQNCKCTACQASYDYYGTMAGAWLSLCNRASIRVDEYLHTQEAIDFFGGVKDWNLLELVYHTSVNPPVEKDDKGNYVLTEDGVGIPKVEKWFDNEGNMWDWEEAWTAEDGSSLEAPVIKAWSDTHERLYTAPNVHFMYAASASDWTHSYYESQNSSWKSIVDGWGGVGGNFFIWAYALNSEGLLYPYNSFDTEFESTRYFKKLGSKYIFWQCQYENPNNSGFTKLRVYLNSKVEFDVNLDYQTLVDRFFKYYYGPAADIMQLYFEQVQAQCRWMEEVNAINGGIHNSKLLYKENWPEGLMHTWIDMMNSAKDLIDEEYAMTNPKLAETYKKHVTIEEQFPTYVLCTTYATSYQALELKKLRKDFLDTFYALGNAAYAEGRKMTLISDGWDLD